MPGKTSKGYRNKYCHYDEEQEAFVCNKCGAAFSTPQGAVLHYINAEKPGGAHKVKDNPSPPPGQEKPDCGHNAWRLLEPEDAGGRGAKALADGYREICDVCGAVRK